MPDPISWSNALPWFLLAAIFGYLLGSIPFGIVLTRLANMEDIRKIGSGNIGATNVLRTGNKLIAVLTLLGDCLKGTIAVIIAIRFGPDTAIISGFFVLLGHCFPVWLKFRGGKGVATFIGVLLGFSWIAMLVFAAIWLSVAAFTRYSSLAALLASFSAPVVLIGHGHIQPGELFIMMTLILWLRHHANIKRLISGSETKIGELSQHNP